MSYRFTPGQVFKLSARARVQWLAHANLDGSCVRAIRTDHAIGKAICTWLENNRTGPLPFSNKELYMQSRDFYPHHLTDAELCNTL